MLCMSRPCRDALGVVLLLSRHCALWGLYRVMHIASLSGRPTGCHAAITALRPVELVPCYACRVPAGTPYSQSCCSHGTALCGACTVLSISRPCRDALGVVMLLSRHCALWGLYRVICIVSLLGCPTDYYTGIMTRPDRDETLHNTVQEDRILAVP